MLRQLVASILSQVQIVSQDLHLQSECDVLVWPRCLHCSLRCTQPIHASAIQVEEYDNWKTPVYTQFSGTHHHHHYLQSSCSAWRNSTKSQSMGGKWSRIATSLLPPAEECMPKSSRSLPMVLGPGSCLQDLDLMAATERLPWGAPRFLLTHLVTAASVAAECSSAVVPRLGGVICEVVDMMEGCWWKLPVYHSEMRWLAIFLTTIDMVSQVNCIDFPCGIMLLKVPIWSYGTWNFSNHFIASLLL